MIRLLLELNATHDFPDTLLDYLMQANEDADVLFWNADRFELQVGRTCSSLPQFPPHLKEMHS